MGTEQSDCSDPGAPKPRGGMRARDVVLAVMSDWRAGRHTARQSLDALMRRYRIAAGDVPLATEIALGVMRHRLTIEAVLQPALKAPWHRVGPTIQHILLIAAYQLIWLDAVPEYAAVNEAVEQAKREGGARGGAFVNAVLRGLLRHMRERRARPQAGGDERVCIRVDRDALCRFDVPILPDRSTDPCAFLSQAYSHPAELVGRWIAHYGADVAESICAAGASRPPTVLRPNRMRADASALAQRLTAEGFDAVVTADGMAVVIVAAAPSGGLFEGAAFAEGLFQPQDVTAMQAVRLADPQPGQVVVDLCAGVGTKATQAAELMQDRGRVIAADVDADKLERLRRNCDRLGLSCVEAMAADRVAEAVASVPSVDVILVDVPCSNTGVLGRRPEARYRFSARRLAGLLSAQAGLLDQAASIAGPTTRIVYSTCSIEPEENDEQVAAFRRRHAEWQIVHAELTLPRGDVPATDRRDGGYSAVLCRNLSGDGAPQ